MAGVVHKGEWVASQELLQSPVARPMIDALDYAQRTNTIGSLRSEDVSRSIVAPSVYAQSASNTPTVIVQSPQSDAQTEIAATHAVMKEYVAVIKQLKERLDEMTIILNVTLPTVKDSDLFWAQRDGRTDRSAAAVMAICNLCFIS